MLFVANDTLLFSEGWEGNTIIAYFLSTASFSSQDSDALIDRYLSLQSVSELSITNVNLLINRELSLNSLLSCTTDSSLNILRELHNSNNQSITITDVVLSLQKLLNFVVQNEVSINDSSLNVLRELYNSTINDSGVTDSSLKVLRELYNSNNQSITITDVVLSLQKLLNFVVNTNINNTNSSINILRELYNSTINDSGVTDSFILIERILGLTTEQNVELSDAFLNFIYFIQFLVSTEITENNVNLPIERTLTENVITESLSSELSVLIERFISVNLTKLSEIENHLTVQRELTSNPQLSATVNDTDLLITRFLNLLSTTNIQENDIDVNLLRELTQSINNSFLISPLNTKIQREIYTKHNLVLDLNDIKIYIERILKLLIEQGVILDDSTLGKSIIALFECETKEEVGNFLLSVTRDLQSNVNTEITLKQIRLYLFAITQFNRLAMKIIIDKYNMRDLSDDMRFTDFSEKISIEDFTCEEDFKDLSDNTDIQIIT